MNIKEACEILKKHNEWRRYDGEIHESTKMICPKKLGTAIDTVTQAIDNHLQTKEL